MLASSICSVNLSFSPYYFFFILFFSSPLPTRLFHPVCGWVSLPLSLSLSMEPRHAYSPINSIDRARKGRWKRLPPYQPNHELTTTVRASIPLTIPLSLFHIPLSHLIHNTYKRTCVCTTWMVSPLYICICIYICYILNNTRWVHYI